MNLIFLGPPGCGKGTQAKKLEEQLNIVQISTGDLLRNAIKQESAIGHTAKSFMDKGELVPDSIVIDLVKERTLDSDCKNGFILDGFPRTLEQGKYIDSMDVKIDGVIYFKIDDDIIVKRITGRRVCSKCGAMYHINFLPPKEEGICDKCGGKLYQRQDDKENVIRERLKVYNKSTKPLLDFYSKKNKLFALDGAKPINEVSDALLRIVNTIRT